MNKKSVMLSDLVDLSNPQKVLAEIKNIVSRIHKDADEAFVEKIINETVDLFKGCYPGYRASNAKYHDLSHTLAVVLAMVRLMHGCSLEGHAFSPLNIILGLTAALFHDIGFIQLEDDCVGSGAKYTIGHEQRSIDFMRQYLSENQFSSENIKDCSQAIQCTMLDVSPKTIGFRTPETESLGKMVGSADLVAQLSDRMYLEKLLLLFKEIEEAALPGIDSELDLLRKTANFFELVAQKRLKNDFGNVAASMRSHFIHRWDIDRDLYAESILKNIEYIKYLNALCKENFDCYLKNLKRGGIVKEIFGGA
jgi:hypothetical protein